MTKILIIEDERPIRERLTRALAYEGYEALAAADGRQGIDLARRYRPDVVIADILLPEINGIGVVRVLRDQAEVRHSPIIVMTAVLERSMKRLMADLGADDYITKPFSIAEMLDAIEAQVRKKRLETA